MTDRKAKVWIDGTEHEADPGRNMLEVSLQLGRNLPFFCWHPALGSVGACRQCAVKQFRDEKDTRGRIVMACMTPAAEGTRIAIDDPEARAFRASVIEWLMVNHPHDCPVCDEGGECHLQDMTVMTGHNYRRFRFRKRTHRNQDLGPLVNHEMNRCIECYRCVRFYREYAGYRDLQVFAAHDMVYFGRERDGTLESPFAGNLVEVCPTGVFTDKTLQRHYTRKWDLRTAPSVCVHCSLGCNTIPGERYGSLRRIRNRYNGAVNGYFLCDRGRYGYEFVNHERRIRAPLLPRGPEQPAETISVEEALRRAAPFLADSGGVIGIGSPRASMESNFALSTLVGPGRFHQGITEAEAALLRSVLEAMRQGPRTISLREAESCDAVLVVGEDVTQTAPLLGLALRQASRREPMRVAERLKVASWDDAAIREAVQDRVGPIYIASPWETELDRSARAAVRGTPEEIAAFARAVAHELGATSADAPQAALEPARARLAGDVAGALRDAERPLVVSGTGCGSAEVLDAAVAVARALALARGDRPSGMFLTVPECDSLGLALLGGEPLEAAFRAAEEGRVRTAVILENDLFRRAAPEKVDAFLRAVPHVVVLDHLAHPTAARAEILLPAATFAEADGTLVNNEGRAQRFFQVFVPAAGEIRESWRWLRDLAAAAGLRPAAEGPAAGVRSAAKEPGAPAGMAAWCSLDDVIEALVAAHPGLQGIRDAAPAAGFRLAGEKLARAPHRFSGRTAMFAHLSVREPAPPPDPDTFFSFTMEGYDGDPPPAWMPHIWDPGWNSVQALNRFQEEIGGPLRGGDPGVRLIEPSAGTPAPRTGSASRVPESPGRAQGENWPLVPVHFVFGSEELSASSSGVAALTPEPAFEMSAASAARAGVTAGVWLEASWDGGHLLLPLRIRAGMADGVVGWPVGTAGLLLGAVPERARIRPVPVEAP